MKARAYVRVAKGGGRKGYKLDVSASPSPAPLSDSNRYALPTVAFAVDFVIPDELFKQAEKVVAEINIAAEQAVIAGEVASV